MPVMPAMKEGRAAGAAWMAVALAALLSALPGPAPAQRVEGDRAAAEGIYQAEVQVRSQGEADRQVGRPPHQVHRGEGGEQGRARGRGDALPHLRPTVRSR